MRDPDPLIPILATIGVLGILFFVGAEWLAADTAFVARFGALLSWVS